MYDIKMGIPDMEFFWEDLTKKVESEKATKSEVDLYNRIGKALVFLSNNPRHPGLHSHDIEELTNRYGCKVWESYLENNTPSAGRIFWAYGPNKMEITILSIEPHPNDKKSNAYGKIRLSAMGNIIGPTSERK